MIKISLRDRKYCASRIEVNRGDLGSLNCQNLATRVLSLDLASTSSIDGQAAVDRSLARKGQSCSPAVSPYGFGPDRRRGPQRGRTRCFDVRMCPMLGRRWVLNGLKAQWSRRFDANGP